VFFYLSNEGLSILENVAAIGLQIPLKLNIILSKLHDNNPHVSEEPPDTDTSETEDDPEVPKDLEPPDDTKEDK